MTEAATNSIKKERKKDLPIWKPQTHPSNYMTRCSEFAALSRAVPALHRGSLL